MKEEVDSHSNHLTSKESEDLETAIDNLSATYGQYAAKDSVIGPDERVVLSRALLKQMARVLKLKMRFLKFDTQN